MEFPSEFYWVAPSGKKLLTSYMADHYSAGWWMDSALTLEEAEEQTYASFVKLKSVAATKNVLLPVGTDYSPPNKWVSLIARDWNGKYISPRFEMSTTRRFFDAVRSAAERDGVRLRPQSRDMNPLYTGKDVSFIDTKQANRLAENMLIDAEKFATVASLLGARYPTEAVDKAWRQLLFNAHHDGITGSESDQVYLDLLGGWREAWELARSVLQSALSHIGTRIDVPVDESGGQRTIAVFNPSSWARAGMVRLDVPFEEPGTKGLKVTNDTGTEVPVLVEGMARHSDRSLEEATVVFRADDVPPLGYRTYRVIATEDNPDNRWIAATGFTAENDRYLVEVDPERGGGISRLYDKATARELLKPGELGNELLAYDEYPNHPSFGEGPWHLTPTGGVQGTSGSKAEVTVERSPIGQRLTVRTSLADCVVTQEILLWKGVDQVEFRTHLDGFSGQDTLFRVRFPADCEGAMPVSEVGSAVVGRTFGFPEADTAEVPFTLEYPAYNWFGLSSCVRIALEGGKSALQAISVAEVVAPDDEDWAVPVEQLSTALVRQGVTTTVSSPEGARYGSIDIDSNVPDARIALGGPEQNRFTETVLQSAGQEYENEFKRQVSSTGYARVWVPASSPFGEVWVFNPDLRDARALPVLIVAGSDRASDEQAAADLVNELADGLVELTQPSELAGDGQLADYGVAVMNRGLPSFSIDRQRGLYLSLLRSCSGWPSGIWIDPPRRTLPDGSNFQFQHWSHTFEYAVMGFPGDWRGAQVVNAAHDFNHPLFSKVLGPQAGELPARLSFFEVEPASVVLSALKPLGNPMASQARKPDPVTSFVARVYEANGRPTEVTIRSHWPLADGFVTNLMEETRERLEPQNGSISLGVSGYQIATFGATPTIDKNGRSDWASLGPTAEPAQPVFSAYWLHNKGAAPVGYQPVTVRVRPAGVAADGPFSLTVSVASERTDGPVAGILRVSVPDSWSADPIERPYRLEPGAHLTDEITVSPSAGGAPGRYFIAVRIDDEAGQIHEDISTVDYLAGEHVTSKSNKPALSVDPVTGRAVVAQSESNQRPQLGNELEIELLTPEVRLAPGKQGRIEVRLANVAAGEIRGEVQVLSPYDTWSMISPWTQGFEVAAGETADLSFRVKLPYSCRSGRYWAVIKVMYFGRLHYTESIPFEVLEPAD